MTDTTPRDAVAALVEAAKDMRFALYGHGAARPGVDAAINDAAALLDRPAPAAVIDLGEHGELRNATVRNATVKGVRPEQVSGCLFVGGPAPAAELWCLHIEGPDDVYPAPSREDAQRAADLFAAWEARQPKGEYSPAMRAVVAPWPHDAASHAAGVGRFAAEWLQVPAELGIGPAPAAAGDADEDAYVIEQMGRLLAEIAVIVNGPEPANGRWSYHDLPKKVARLKQATHRAECCGVKEGELHRPDCAALAAAPAAGGEDVEAARFALIAAEGTPNDFAQEFEAVRQWFAARKEPTP